MVFIHKYMEEEISLECPIAGSTSAWSPLYVDTKIFSFDFYPSSGSYALCNNGIYFIRRMGLQSFQVPTTSSLWSDHWCHWWVSRDEVTYTSFHETVTKSFGEFFFDKIKEAKLSLNLKTIRHKPQNRLKVCNSPQEQIHDQTNTELWIVENLMRSFIELVAV